MQIIEKFLPFALNSRQFFLQTRHYQVISLTQKNFLTYDIFDLWRLPKYRCRTGWHQNNVRKQNNVI